MSSRVQTTARCGPAFSTPAHGQAGRKSTRGRLIVPLPYPAGEVDGWTCSGLVRQARCSTRGIRAAGLARKIWVGCSAAHRLRFRGPLAELISSVVEAAQQRITYGTTVPGGPGKTLAVRKAVPRPPWHPGRPGGWISTQETIRPGSSTIGGMTMSGLTPGLT